MRRYIKLKELFLGPYKLILTLNKLLKCQKCIYYFYFKIYLLYNVHESNLLNKWNQVKRY